MTANQLMSNPICSKFALPDVIVVSGVLTESNLEKVIEINRLLVHCVLSMIYFINMHYVIGSQLASNLI